MPLKPVNEWKPGEGGLSAHTLDHIKRNWQAAKEHTVTCKLRECRRQVALNPSLLTIDQKSQARGRHHAGECCPCSCGLAARKKRHEARRAMRPTRTDARPKDDKPATKPGLGGR